MTSRVENINTDILRQCREQIGLTLFEVEERIKTIAEIENGTKKPTFKQLDKLSGLYKVPRWVFVSKQLPDKYQFDKAVPAFRQLANSNAGIFSDSKVRSLIAQVERFRNLILELLDDMGETIVSFNPPELADDTKPEDGAMLIRKWLWLADEKFDFETWKKLLEEKGIFVFMTSKYKDWSHIDKKLFRGLAIYHSTLPIIIINDSDAKKAQSFTLFHELGHLLKNVLFQVYHNREIGLHKLSKLFNVKKPSYVLEMEGML